LALEPCRSAVYSHRLPGGPLTRVETGSIIARHVPIATHGIVDVVTERGRLGRILASAETKLVGSNKIRPFMYLFNLTSESRREYKASDRIAIAVGTMGI